MDKTSYDHTLSSSKVLSIKFAVHSFVSVLTCILLLTGCQTTPPSPDNSTSSQYRSMGPVTFAREQTTPQSDADIIFLIDFARGFANDSFTIMVDDTIVAEVEIDDKGRIPAEWISLESNQYQLLLNFRDNQRQREWLFFLDLSQGTYFSIDYIDEKLVIRQSQRPFLYDTTIPQ